MKVIAINGSPRKKWNTAQLLQQALKGAESVGAETEFINLYDLNYRGCISCFGCKRKEAVPCKCFMKDDLTPVLEKVHSADALLLGSPIYFGDVTGQMRCFLERLNTILLQTRFNLMIILNTRQDSLMKTRNVSVMRNSFLEI